MLGVLRSWDGFVEQQNPPQAPTSPRWGLLHAALPPTVAERIRKVVDLRDEGDVLRPEKTLIRLAEHEHLKVGGRCFRTIKLKGISRQLARIKRGERRHIRLLGRGDIPYLVPYLDAAGEQRFVEFDVGEPYGAKRLRSVATEVSVTLAARAANCATLLPLGAGFYADPDLEFKGEPAAFSIWGVEHPNDQRFDQSWKQDFHQCRLQARAIGTGAENASWALIKASFEGTRHRLEAILRQARTFHAAGLVHHELQFDNHAFCGDSLSVLDWEEAAPANQLTRAQFMESVLIDLFKLICYCCAYQREYVALSEQQGCSQLSRTAAGLDANWLEVYFDSGDPAVIREFAGLLPMNLRDQAARGPFRAVLLPRIQSLYQGLDFGSGVDWETEARPFLTGFGPTSPAWQPHASTTFDLKLFTRKGNRGVPCENDEMMDNEAVSLGETAVHEGRFEDALTIYAAQANAAPTTQSLYEYYCHNAAGLCFALRRDDEAAEYFRRAYG